MKKIVVDTSVIVKWFITENELHISNAERLLKDAIDKKVILFVPSLASYEFGNSLIKRKTDLLSGFDYLETSYKSPVNVINETEDLALLTYRIAREYGITYYDASFVALAKQEGAILVTDNPKHQAKSTEVKVIALKDY